MVVHALKSWLWLLVFLSFTLERGDGQSTEVEVQLAAPRWAARGSSATLSCLHQVPPRLLYKVEFLRAGTKLLQYVRERVPPFTNYTFNGGKINMSLATENSVTIDNLEPSATGLYWCEVSLETPIFTAASPPHLLNVVYSQKHPPIITFGKPDAVVEGTLRANCTSAPANPAPKLTWYINDEKQLENLLKQSLETSSLLIYKGGTLDGNATRNLLASVPEDSVQYFSYRVSSLTRTKGGGGYRHRKQQHRYIAPEFNYTGKYWALVSETTTAPPVNNIKHHKCTLKEAQTDEMAKIQTKPRAQPVPPISLWVSIAELRAPAHGKLQLTCTATIPEDLQPGEKYTDVKSQTVTVAVNELSLKRPHSETTHADATSSFLHHQTWLIGCSLIISGHTYVSIYNSLSY